MKKPFLFISALLMTWYSLLGQNINEYKYVWVPRSFEFSKEPDQFQLNSLTAFLLEKHGFHAIMEGETWPEDLKTNRCAALNAEVLSDSGMFNFVTKVKLVIKNCEGKIVFESKEGRSRLKKMKFAFQEALRDAFTSVATLNDAYSTDKATLPSPEPAEPEDSAISEVMVFIWPKQNEYKRLKKGEGLKIKKSPGAVEVMTLYPTSKRNYIYRSETTNGTAYFDENKNLIVEYLDTRTGKVQKTTYRLRSQ